MQFNLGSAGNVGPVRSKGGGCSIGGIFVGLLLVPLGFYLVYYGEIKLINHGKVFERVQMMSTTEAKTADGTQAKFRGSPQGTWLTVDYYDKSVLYFNRRVEQYEREEDSEGNVDYTWKSTNESSAKWADFTIDDIKIAPSKAKPVGAKQVFVGIKPVNSWRDKFDPTIVGSHSPSVGDRRLTLSVIEPTGDLIVFGDMVGASVSSGSTFIVSALDEGATTEHLKTEYKITYWLMKGGAVFAIAIGILSIFGPLLSLVGYIPFIGTRITGAFSALAFGFAIVSVILVTLLIKLFWVILLLAAIGIVVGVVIAIKSPRTPPGVVAPEIGPVAEIPPTATPPQAPPIPQPTPELPQVTPPPDPVSAPPAASPTTAAPKFCSNCGAETKPENKHCGNCGHNLRE